MSSLIIYFHRRAEFLQMACPLEETRFYFFPPFIYFSFLCFDALGLRALGTVMARLRITEFHMYLL